MPGLSSPRGGCGRFEGIGRKREPLLHSVYTVPMPGKKQRGKRAAGVTGRRKIRRAATGLADSGWSAQRLGGVVVLHTAALDRMDWLIHGYSTRPGGISCLGPERVLNLGSADWDTPEAVAANGKRFLAALASRKPRRGGGSGQTSLVTLRQCHSDLIHAVSTPLAEPLAGDALLTSTPGLMLAVRTADCLPILLADTRHRAVAAVHAGWRGTLARIAQKALGRMHMEFGTRPEDVVAALGPSIGGCCYEVGPEVVQAYAAQFPNAREWFDGPFERLAANDDPAPFPWLSMTPPGHEVPAPRAQLDLRAANRWQLTAAGVRGERIVSSRLCTACRTDLLFSHRREQGRTGRLLAVIGVVWRAQDRA